MLHGKSAWSRMEDAYERKVMIRNYIRIVLFLGLTSWSSGWAFGPKTFFSTRSQSVDAAAELVGWEQLIHQYDVGYWYGVFSIMPYYKRSLDSKHIAEFLLGSKCLTFSGSRFSGRGATDILADYFGLPLNFGSIVSFDPVITNFIMDLNFYIGLDSVLRGLYIRAHLPVVHTKWDLQLDECVTSTAGTGGFYPAGYMGPDRVTTDLLAVDVKQAFEGHTVFGDMREPLAFGKIFGRESLIRVAELQLALGWDFAQRDWYHCGMLVRLCTGTGNKPNAEFLFEPIAGNGGHWELGAGFTSHVECWRSVDDAHRFAMYFDMNVTHLFASKQKRSFDFTNNGNGSRYILIESIVAPSNNLFIGAAGPAAPNQYQGRLINAINKTTFRTKIRIPVQVDAVLKFAYQVKQFEFDFGYDIWFRSAETLVCRDCFESNMWALKGDAQVYGFEASGNPVALNPSQHNATINSGQGDKNGNFQNLNVDSPAAAASSAGLLDQLKAPDTTDLGIAAVTVRTSNPPILLTDADINESSALMPRALSHKIFTHINYYFVGDIKPYIGFGGMFEWAKPDPCDNSAFAQWGIWAKGGVAF